jgi:large subunit ribosomal protein L18
MDKQSIKAVRRQRRIVRTRRLVSGTTERPRLAVYKSLNHIYAQVIDDLSGQTVASASTVEKKLGLEKTGNASAAAKVGEAIAQRAKAKGIAAVVFDRRGFRYHGRLKALADAARKAGLSF